MNYYNEHDPKAAAWLRELINQGLTPQGDVDTRSIIEVRSHELKKYTQCHFFAGIGGWPLALQLAGWPADRPVWTGSCPCQPFSTAGKGLAQEDERHLWPVFFNLIKEQRPEHVIGEQVANAIGHGWLDGISSDLEAEGYACGATVLGAHSIGSPHQRQRLYWVAHTMRECWDKRGGIQGGCEGVEEEGGRRTSELCRRAGDDPRCDSPQRAECVEARGFGIVEVRAWQEFQRRPPWRSELQPTPLAHGVPARVVRLRGYGNAIVPQVAAEFVKAYLEEA